MSGMGGTEEAEYSVFFVRLVGSRGVQSGVISSIFGADSKFRNSKSCLQIWSTISRSNISKIILFQVAKAAYWGMMTGFVFTILCWLISNHVGIWIYSIAIVFVYQIRSLMWPHPIAATRSFTCGNLLVDSYAILDASRPLPMVLINVVTWRIKEIFSPLFYLRGSPITTPPASRRPATTQPFGAVCLCRFY